MHEFAAELSARLEGLRQQGLGRRLRPVDSAAGQRVCTEGRWLLNFSSNDYLGLADSAELKEAARQAVAEFGAGAGASRLICGSLRPHQELEETLAAFKETEAAVAFASGYATALGAITALLGHEDVVVIDRLAHACLVDAARLCGAKLRVFAHNDLADLERILRWADQRASGPAAAARRRRTLIVTESLFSMDGDLAPLAEIVALKDQYGAWLMVDEAHATGLYGPHRRGLAEWWGVAERVEVQMGTLGKALGAAGGYICGSRFLVDYLVNRARSFIFSTAPVPAAVAAATAAVRLVQGPAGESRCAALWQRVDQYHLEAGPKAPDTPGKEDRLPLAPIVPLVVGPEAKAVEMGARLEAQGFLMPAIRYPTVGRGKARLRLTFSASHTAEDVTQLGDALRRLGLLGVERLASPRSADGTPARHA